MEEGGGKEGAGAGSAQPPLQCREVLFFRFCSFAFALTVCCAVILFGSFGWSFFLIYHFVWSFCSSVRPCFCFFFVRFPLQHFFVVRFLCSSAVKVKKWNEQPPSMYSVRIRPPTKVINNAADGDGDPGTPKSSPRPVTPRRPLHSSFTVGRIDLDEDQLGSGRVLLVDDRNGHIYLWCGNMSTFKHRGFGLEAATRVKADSPKGGQVTPCTRRKKSDQVRPLFLYLDISGQTDQTYP